MKLTKVFGIVFAIHSSVILAVLIGPGCQTIDRVVNRDKSPKKQEGEAKKNNKPKPRRLAGASKKSPTQRGEPRKEAKPIIPKSLSKDKRILTPEDTLPKNAKKAAKPQVAQVSAKPVIKRFKPTRPADPIVDPRDTNSVIPLSDTGVVSAPMGDTTETAQLIKPESLSLPEPAQPKENWESFDKVRKTYNVQKGDSLWRISRKFGVSLDSLLELNHLNQNSVLNVGQELILPFEAGDGDAPVATPAKSSGAPIDPNAEIYKVRRGDTLSKIARRFSVTVDDLKAANGMSSDFLRVGQRLALPGGAKRSASSSVVSSAPVSAGKHVHVVSRGESVGAIAKRYRVSPADVQRWNNLRSINQIFVGQKLVIHAGGTSAPTPKPAPVSSPVLIEPIDKTLDEKSFTFPESDLSGEVFENEIDIPIVPISESGETFNDK